MSVKSVCAALLLSAGLACSAGAQTTTIDQEQPNPTDSYQWVQQLRQQAHENMRDPFRPMVAQHPGKVRHHKSPGRHK